MMKDLDPDRLADGDKTLRPGVKTNSESWRYRLIALQDRVATILRNGNANLRHSLWLFKRRLARPSSLALLPKIGHRLQDTLAYGMLAVGLSVIFFDLWSYAWINSLPGSYYVFFWTFTDLGKAHWSLIPTGVIGLVILALDWDRLSRSVRDALHVLFLQVTYIFTVVVASGLVAVVLKWTLGRARPKLSPTYGPTHFDFLALDSDFTSFPSGHSTTVGAIAVCLALLIPSWARMILVLAFWLSASRIMVSAHYPSDVIGGTLFGAAFAWYVARSLARRRLLFRCDENDWIRKRYSTWRVFRKALREFSRFAKLLPLDKRQDFVSEGPQTKSAIGSRATVSVPHEKSDLRD